MGQLTLRIPDALSERLKVAAGSSGKSVNRWATDVLNAAVDPDFAGDETAVLRERLARAGLLVRPEPVLRSRPKEAAFARARAAAGRGRRPSDLVAEGRR